MNENSIQLSVVSTLYNSKIFLEKFLEEMLDSIKEIGIVNFELIFVNDGSPDASMSYLLERKNSIPEIKVIDLSRNFGHHYAMQAGLLYASGEFVFLIDNDLETPPNILVDFYTMLRTEPELDVVYAYQEERKGRFVERYFGSIFWKVINKVSDIKIPYNILTERLMRREYVKELLKLNDANLFLGGMFYWVGFNQKGIAVKKGQREGRSTYTLQKRIQLVFEAVTSFSGKPLQWLFYLGVNISLFSILFLIYLIIKKTIYQNDVQLGWTSLIAINILLLGVISTFLGLIGIYIYKIFKQVQGRPNSVIKKIYE